MSSHFSGLYCCCGGTFCVFFTFFAYWKKNKGIVGHHFTSLYPSKGRKTSRFIELNPSLSFSDSMWIRWLITISNTAKSSLLPAYISKSNEKLDGIDCSFSRVLALWTMDFILFVAIIKHHRWMLHSLLVIVIFYVALSPVCHAWSK